MSIKFEKTPYLRAVKEKDNFNSEIKIFNHAKTALHFKYLDVTPQEFNKKYLTIGWFGRKVIALPAAIGSALVKTIYHLAKAIIIGFCKAFSDDGKYSKAQLFYMGRDFQESFGWLVSLFNDRYGQYHIQASKFHKTCYQCFLSGDVYSQSEPLNSNPNPKRNPLTNDIFQPHSSSKPEFPIFSKHPISKKFPVNSSFNLNNSQPKQNPFFPLEDDQLQENLNFENHSSNLKKTYALENELDEELKNISYLNLDNREIEELHVQLAEKYLSIDCVEKALKAIDTYYVDTETKNKFIFKIAQAYHEKGENELAIKTFKELSYSAIKKKNTFFMEVAESYYLKGNLKDALKTIDTHYLDTETKVKFILKTANDNLGKGEIKEAIIAFNKLSYTTTVNEQAAFFEKVAESCYLKSNLGEALDAIDAYYIDTKVKDKFILKITNAYFEKGEIEEAIKAFAKLSSTTTENEKEAFFEKVAESYYLKENLKDAFNKINTYYFNTKTKDKFIYKIANAYLEKGETKEAIQTFEALSSGTKKKEKEAFFEKLAESYYLKDKLQEALNTIDKVVNKTEAKEKFIAKIAKSYFSKGHLVMALQVINKIEHDFKTKSTFLIQLAQSFFSNNNEEKVFSVITIILHDSLKKKMIENGNFDIYHEIINGWIYSEKTVEFFSKLKTECYPQVKNYFVNNNPLAALQEIIKKSTSNATLQDFINLKKKNPFTHGNFEQKEATKSKAASYLALGLDPNKATIEDVKAAYKKFALKFHPDKITRKENETDNAFTARKSLWEKKFLTLTDAYKDIIP